MTPQRPLTVAMVLAMSLFVCALVGCDAEPVKSIDVEAPGGNHDVLVELAKTDHVTLIEQCRENFRRQNVTDYTCMLLRQERIDGTLHNAQEVAVKFRAQPFSVTMTWMVNPGDGDRCVYIEGMWPDANGNSQMLIRPTGILLQLATGGSVLRLPDSADVMRGTRKPITQFGFENLFESLLPVYAQARAADDCEETFLGVADVSGNDCIVLQRIIRNPQSENVAPVTKIFVDRNRLLPIRLEGYGLDDDLIFAYEYDQLAMNVGLTDEDFTPEANEITVPGALKKTTKASTDLSQN
jgi:hypothetical protein